MKTSDNGYYSFEIEGVQTFFQDDMHDFAIMSDSETHEIIHYPNYQLAKQESDRLNALNIKDLETRPLGIPWRIMLVTWQDSDVLME